jgi:prophage antirepressor-like protein
MEKNIMSNLSIFKFEENEIRTVVIDGEIWFVAKDVCDVLEIKNVSDALSRLDEDEKKLVNTATIVTSDSSKNQQLSLSNPMIYIINESGLYSLVLTSRKPQAKVFKKWVTSEVLPSIRKHGYYSLKNSNLPSYQIEDPIKRAEKWIEEQKEKLLLENKVKEQDKVIEILQPKADTFDIIVENDNDIDIRVLTKLLNGRNVKIKESEIRDYGLNNNFWYYDNYNLGGNIGTKKLLFPYAQHTQHFYIKKCKTPIQGELIVYPKLLITKELGVKYLVTKLLKDGLIKKI